MKYQILVLILVLAISSTLVSKEEVNTVKIVKLPSNDLTAPHVVFDSQDNYHMVYDSIVL